MSLYDILFFILDIPPEPLLSYGLVGTVLLVVCIGIIMNGDR